MEKRGDRREMTERGGEREKRGGDFNEEFWESLETRVRTDRKKKKTQKKETQNRQTRGAFVKIRPGFCDCSHFMLQEVLEVKGMHVSTYTLTVEICTDHRDRFAECPGLSVGWAWGGLEWRSFQKCIFYKPHMRPSVSIIQTDR